MENKDFDGDGDKDDKGDCAKNIGTILLSLSSSNLFHFHFFQRVLMMTRMLGLGSGPQARE